MPKRKTSKLNDKTFPKLTICDHEVNVKRDTHIGLDIDRELRQQPGLFAWYVSLAEMARERWKTARMKAKARLEDLTDELSKEHKRTNITTLRNMAARDSVLRVLWKQQIEAEHNARRMAGFVTVMDQRGKLLQSIGAGRRREWENVNRDHVKE